MCQESRLLLAIAYITVSCVCVQAYKNGAGHEACETLDPGTNHGSQGADPVPYEMKIIGATSYTNDQQINVLVRGEAFSGLMVQARRKGDAADWRPVGYFAVPNNSSGLQLMNCVQSGDTITQFNAFMTLKEVVFTWIAPPSNHGEIEFVANVIKDITWWYNNVKSTSLPYTAPTATTTTTTTTTSSTDVTTTRESYAPSIHVGSQAALALTFVLVSYIL